MDVIKGVVSQFKSEAIIGKTSSSGTISHSNVATFRVDGKPVTARFSQPIDLADGERAVVGGRFIKGVLHALAVKNAETGVTYGDTLRRLYLFPAFLVAFGLVMAFSAKDATTALVVIALSGIPALLLFKYVQRRTNAIDIVRRS